MNEQNIKKLSENELEKVNAGSNLSMHFFNTPEEVRFIFWVNDIIYVKQNFLSKTTECVVIDRKVFDDPQYHCYTDIYRVRSTKREPDGSYYLDTWVSRDDIVNQSDD